MLPTRATARDPPAITCFFFPPDPATRPRYPGCLASVQRNHAPDARHDLQVKWRGRLRRKPPPPRRERPLNASGSGAAAVSARERSANSGNTWSRGWICPIGETHSGADDVEIVTASRRCRSHSVDFPVVPLGACSCLGSGNAGLDQAGATAAVITLAAYALSTQRGTPASGTDPSTAARSKAPPAASLGGARRCARLTLQSGALRILGEPGGRVGFRTHVHRPERKRPRHAIPECSSVGEQLSASRSLGTR